jgi:anaerobic ribonucleoside-triphosphate reductase
MVFVHGILFSVIEALNRNFLNTSIAQMNHYRDNYIQKTDNNTIEDKTIWRYKDELMKNVEKVLKESKFQP